jgi:hypothetical protein
MSTRCITTPGESGLMDEGAKEIIKDAIRQKFLPVVREEDADLMISTDRIMLNLKQVSKDVQPKDVVDIMEELGFVYGCNEEMEFVWLLGER